MLVRKIGRVLVYCVAGLACVILLLLAAVKILLSSVPHYQAEIREWVHVQTGYHIAFASVSPAFRWYGPELYFKRVQLRSKDDQRVLAGAAGARLGLDMWQLLRDGRLLAGRVEIDAPNVSVTRLGPSRFAIASEIEIGGDGPGTIDIRSDALPQGSLAIRHAVFSLRNWNPALAELTLQNVSLDIRHDARAISVELAAQLPAALGATWNARAAAVGSGELQSLQWSALLRARGMAFAGWHKLLPDYLEGLEAGAANFDLAAVVSGGALTHADLEFAASGVALRLAAGPLANFDQMSGALTLAHAGDQWRLTGRRVRAARRDPQSEFDVRWRSSDAGLLSVSGQASFLRVDTLLPLAGILPQKSLREQLLEIAPTGEWLDTSLALARDNGAGPWRMQVRGKFHNIGFAAVGRAPGMRGLSGSLAGDESGGHVFIDAADGSFSWPAQFQQPLALRKMQARIYWSRTAQQLLVASPEWLIQTADATAQGKVAWLQAADGTSPVLTLVATAQDGIVANAKNYFPRALLPAPALAWLDRAFIAGHLSHADVVLRGPLRNFPFRDGSGLFLARCNIEDLGLLYGDGWQPAENITGQAEFRNEGLVVHMQSGHLGALHVDSANARFADFKTGELRIKAQTHTDAGEVLGYLRATPLDAMAEHAFSSVEAHGSLDASVDLWLPFKDFEHRRVLVHGQLEDAELSRTGSSIAASRVGGDFDIDGAQIAHADIHGQLLGGAFQMRARVPKNGLPLTRTQLEFRGTINAAELHDALSLPSAMVIQGDADWRGVLRVAPEPARERSLRISSTLAGFELKFPAPLDKPAGAPLPSWLELQFPAAGGAQGRFALDSLVNGSFALEAGADGMKLAHASFAFGADEVNVGDSQILNVGGSLERVDLAGWLALSGSGKDAKPLSYWLHDAHVHVAELDYLGLAFHDIAVDLAANGSGLRIGVGGSDVNGSILVPGSANAAEPWSLDFQRLRFEVAGRDDSPDAAPDTQTARGFSNPASIPPLNFHATQLIWGERDFGDVRATMRKLDDGVSLQDLTVTAPTFGVTAVGEWRGSGAGVARIEGSVGSTDVQSTLKDLGYADVMQAKSGKLDFDLSWTGPPTPAALSVVTGHVKLAFDKGQLTGIKPGAGRVLGLASIAALPRRLSLDFSDLTDKGLAFDTVRGDFELHDGNAYTDNVVLKGPAAEIGLIGRVGLKNKDYDQTAVVTNSVGNTLPLAALAAGPVVAGAVLVFTQVFKQPLKGLTRGYYRITGGWDNPIVERIKGAEAANATAEAPK